MTPKNQKMRDALKQIEGTITSALAHQPEEDEKCGQFLYDTLVDVFNAADMACHEYRDAESDEGGSREVPEARFDSERLDVL